MTASIRALMRIASAGLIAGVALIAVRDALRTVKGGRFHTDLLADRLDLDPDTPRDSSPH